MAAPSAAPHLVVLGAAAGGGSPQWNCNCEVCRRVRTGDDGASRRTQTSIAVSADGHRYALINASPDLGEQILHTPALHPRREGRHSPIEAVVLTGGEIDQVAGLLTLREGESFSLFASQTTHSILRESPIFGAVDEQIVPRRTLAMEQTTELADADGEPLGIAVESFPVPGKIPLYQETPGQTPNIGEVSENNVALRIEIDEKSVFFIPCCAQVTPELKEFVDGAPLLLFDGTLWRDDELITAGLAEKTGHRMGHVSIDGPDGALAAFSGVAIDRKIFIHINNSNPVLLDDTPERRAVEEAGWEVARDGMELTF